MAKFKVGDVAKPSSHATGCIHNRLIEGKEYLVLHEEGGIISVAGEFKGYDSGEGWSEDWFELAESEASAEFLRNSILDIRSKRDVLHKELLQLDEQEKEAVEKLKEKGFILYE